MVSRRVPDEKYIQFQGGKRKGQSILSAKAHVFFARACRLLVEDRWPLAEYYVYIDTELSDNIDFDPLGLLWTGRSSRRKCAKTGRCE